MLVVLVCAAIFGCILQYENYRSDVGKTEQLDSLSKQYTKLNRNYESLDTDFKSIQLKYNDINTAIGKIGLEFNPKTQKITTINQIGDHNTQNNKF